MGHPGNALGLAYLTAVAGALSLASGKFAQDIEPAVASPAVMSRPTLVVSVVFVVLPEHSWKAGQESGSPDSADTSKQPGTFGTRGTERDNCPDGVSGCGTLISALSRLLSRPLSRRKASAANALRLGVPLAVSRLSCSPGRCPAVPRTRWWDSGTPGRSLIGCTSAPRPF